MNWLQGMPVRSITESEQNPMSRSRWPATLAPVRQLLDQGLKPGKVTILVGENGSGKSTLIEAIAMAYGLSPEGGGTGARHSTRETESDLYQSLWINRNVAASKWGYFVRAETMHGLFTYLEDHPGRNDRQFHRMSHGESFTALLNDTNRFDNGGLFILDEPEAGLSFTAQLTLIGQLTEIAQHPGAQLLLATHSPVIAALPAAKILQLDERGFNEVAWDELDLVDHYRRFLERPGSYLRHLT